MVTEILTFGKITWLALVNSFNPCQIAMLVMVLFTIISQTQEIKRKRIFFIGLMFTSGVFIGYLFYSLVLIQLFQTFAAYLKQNSLWIKSGLAILAMLIGSLQIKDYFFYKPGGIGTEMPLSMRPWAKILIKKITSPFGAFIIGLIITLFLAPCTMTPLIVVTESIAQFGIFGALPWILYFNFIVIAPLLIISFIVSMGFATVENISEWKERNIKRLHLIAGALLFLIGLALLMRWL